MATGDWAGDGHRNRAGGRRSRDRERRRRLHEARRRERPIRRPDERLLPGCRHDPGRTTDEGACPFDAPYWDFLARNEETLRDNPRMALSYANWDRKDDDERRAVRERATAVLERLDDGE